MTAADLDIQFDSTDEDDIAVIFFPGDSTQNFINTTKKAPPRPPIVCPRRRFNGPLYPLAFAHPKTHYPPFFF